MTTPFCYSRPTAVVIQRDNNRQEAFCADEDYRFFLEKLQVGGEKHGCDIHTYILMTNHVYWLVTPHFMRLRVKDVEFFRQELMIREGKVARASSARNRDRAVSEKTEKTG